jgi:hypothetical protein
MRKFNYKIIDSKDVSRAGVFKGRDRADVEAHLCSLGEKGWEIINLDFRELEGRYEFSGVAKREVNAQSQGRG